MQKTYVGLDNGVTGTFGIIKPNGDFTFGFIPTKVCLNYTKAKKNITRIDVVKLKTLLMTDAPLNPFVVIERPMVNPMRFQASVSALRAYEAVLVVLEDLVIPYEVIDSKSWQHELLPRKEGKASGLELKYMSHQVGKRLFPQIDWSQFKDADGILIAEWARRKQL